MAKIRITEGSPLKIVLEKDSGQQVPLYSGELEIEFTDFEAKKIGPRDVEVHIGRG